MRLGLILLCLCICISALLAQPKKDTWDVNAVHGPEREIKFTATEATWSNIDISPDGKEFVFDFLGDLYTLPVSGGEAKLLLGGKSFDCQPRFSPDGKYIAFCSDRAGGDNLWILKRTDNKLHQVTKETFRLLNHPVWTADGQYLIGKKHFTSRRSIGAGEMWMYHISGEGTEGIQLTKRRNQQMDVNEPCVSPDGEYLYFCEDMSPGEVFEYNKDPNNQIFTIRRYEFSTGKITHVTGGFGGACRPQISRNGKKLAFIRRVRNKTTLFIRILENGMEYPIFDSLSKDQQETWTHFGTYPNFCFSPDDAFIYIFGLGKLWKVNIESKTATEIPFSVPVDQKIQEPLHSPQKAFEKEVEIKMIRSAVLLAGNKQVVFNAVGKLWIQDLPNGKPKRLTQSNESEYDPAVGPDGQTIIYASWDDKEGGFVKVIRPGQTVGQKLTGRGFYFHPQFSPDSRKICYQKGEGNSVIGNTFGTAPGIYWQAINSNSANRVSEKGIEPRFDKNGDRIIFVTYESEGKALKSVNLAGAEPLTHCTAKYANQFSISRDGNWIAFRELFQAYIAPFPRTGTPIDLSQNTSSIPVKKVSNDAGTALHFSFDNQSLHWLVGNQYFSLPLKNAFRFVAGEVGDTNALPGADSTQLKLILPHDLPKGISAFTGARIITMKADEIIEDGTIIVKDNQILAVGASAEIKIPAEAKIFDCKGKTIMPGLIDVHAHLGYSSDIIPQQMWSYSANLAFGVTTTHDPSAPNEIVFTQSEMVKIGAMTGPRIFSTGTILYGAEADFKAVINSLDDARKHLRRLKAIGAFSVKSYNQPRRDQRQQIIQAARELNMLVYPEGGSTFFYNLSHIIDGHTGVEHSIPVNPVKNDVAEFWGKSNVGYTPTLIVGYGGIWGENYWYQKTEVWKNKRLLTFTPRGIVDARSRRRVMAPDEEYTHISNAQGCKSIMNFGGKCQLGAHGQLQGLGAHWELWMLAQGGMTPLEAIRCATLYGAQYIGMEKEIGSIESGKLADFIVLAENPLENIQHSESIELVVANGRVYESNTLNQLFPQQVKRPPFYWEEPGYGDNFDFHEKAHSFPRCCSHRH